VRELGDEEVVTAETDRGECIELSSESLSAHR
jgi:hypothetical protein